jgi:hypothetical protein
MKLNVPLCRSASATFLSPIIIARAMIVGKDDRRVLQLNDEVRAFAETANQPPSFCCQ